MKTRRIILLPLILLLGIIPVVLWTRGSQSERYNAILEQARKTDRPAQLQPDYDDVTIPPNIAPMNIDGTVNATPPEIPVAEARAVSWPLIFE